MSDPLTERQRERIEELLERLTPERLNEIERILDMSRALRILWLIVGALLGPFLLAKAADWTSELFTYLGKR